MNYFSIKQILLYFLILILSILITKVLAALREEKLRATLRSEIKNKLRDEQEKINCGRETLKLQQQQLYKERNDWLEEYKKKSDFVKDCYSKAEQVAHSAKKIREDSKNKIAALEKRNSTLEEQLKNARQNIKRRKQQLNELNEVKE